MRYDGDGDELKPVNPTGVRDIVALHQEGKGDQDRDGRQGEAEPCGQPSKPSCPEDADADADLAAGRTGKELA